MQAFSIKNMLQHLGHAPIGIADTAEKAIRMYTSRHPDLILMDIQLNGEKDGVEAAKEMLKLWYKPVIYISGMDVSKYQDRIKQTLNRGILQKPINKEILSDTLLKCYI